MAVDAVKRGWRRLAGDPLTAATTFLFLALTAWLGPHLVQWFFVSAIWEATGPDACAAPGAGACWAFLREKWALILFGAFPHEMMWRPELGTALVILALGWLGWRRWPLRESAFVIFGAFIALVALLDGRPLGLQQVATVRWHGVAIVALLGVFGLAAGIPLGVALAIARRDGPPLVRILCATLIEGLRAIPLVTVLFFAVFVLPLLAPPGWSPDAVVATLIMLIIFHAAYVAEDMRGGLRAVGDGQRDASDSLGLRYLDRLRRVELPQTVCVALPALTNTIIGGFKDTSLVALVGVFDLVATTRMAYSDAAWQRYALEGLLAVGAIYLIVCWLVARHCRTLETELSQWRKR